MTLVTACKVTSWTLAAEQHLYIINPELSTYSVQYKLSHHFCCCIFTISLSSSICICPLDFLIFKDNYSMQENLNNWNLLNIWLKKFTPKKVGQHGCSRCQVIKKHEIIISQGDLVGRDLWSLSGSTSTSVKKLIGSKSDFTYKYTLEYLGFRIFFKSSELS